MCIRDRVLDLYPGQTYTVTFWLSSNNVGGNSSFDALWDNSPLLYLQTSSALTEYSYTVTGIYGGEGGDDLEFLADNVTQGSYNLSDISCLLYTSSPRCWRRSSIWNGTIETDGGMAAPCPILALILSELCSLGWSDRSSSLAAEGQLANSPTPAQRVLTRCICTIPIHSLPFFLFPLQIINFPGRTMQLCSFAANL